MHRVLLLLLPVALHAQLLNGSFESPALAYTQSLTGPLTLTGWTGLAPSNGGNAGLVVGTDNGLSPSDGRQHFCFNGGNPSDTGWIQQTIATTPGAAYHLTFDVGRAGGTQPLSLLATISADTTLASLAASPPPTRTYQTLAIDFIAASSETTLRFADTSGGNSISDLYLDNVTLSAVPEPSTYASLAGALALVYARLRRRA